MKFGIFYELQLPKPWVPDDERQLVQDALAQVELAVRGQVPREEQVPTRRRRRAHSLVEECPDVVRHWNPLLTPSETTKR